jgi:hypothetical protein
MLPMNSEEKAGSSAGGGTAALTAAGVLSIGGGSDTIYIAGTVKDLAKNPVFIQGKIKSLE